MDEETLEELKDELKQAGAKTAHVRLPVPCRRTVTCAAVALATRVLTYDY